MNNRTLLWFVIGAGILAALVTGGVVSMALWKQSARASKWLPALGAAEAARGIPTDLLARMAYQESHWRDDIISGRTPSSAGNLGLMQLLPKYFASVRVPIPFTDADTAAQIDQAATELARLYAHYGNWQNAVAAYNWGEGNLDDYLAGNGGNLPSETQNYIAQVFADVPAAANT